MLQVQPVQSFTQASHSSSTWTAADDNTNWNQELGGGHTWPQDQTLKPPESRRSSTTGIYSPVTPSRRHFDEAGVQRLAPVGPNMSNGLPTAYAHKAQHDYSTPASFQSSYAPSHKQTYSARQMQQQYAPSSAVTSRPASPVFSHLQPPNQNLDSKGAGSNAIASYLQIPSTITSHQGSLAEFAAQITCLFWFESSSTLQHIENSDHTPFPTSRLVPEATPATGFLKWVTTILSTTQVTQNVILLALLFVYRLKKQNPSVKGKPGSEYRLLTVALMLGNKFLDDNTYTNRTWAEVSGISVVEIHVMEVEFLSHMKYNLYTSKDEWQHWHEQLGKFHVYFDRASRKLTEISPQPMTIRPPNLQIPYPLPSPPASTNASPPYMQSTTPTRPISAVSQATMAQLLPRTASPSAMLPELDPHHVRKRSLDQDTAEEPPYKRMHLHHPAQTASPLHHNYHGPLPALPNLPMPSLPAPGMHQTAHSRTHTPVQMQPISSRNHGLPHSQAATQNWLQGVYQHPSYSMPTNELPPTNGHFTRSRQHTPAPPSLVATSAAHSYPSTVAHSGSQNLSSPSHFLMKRTSPYRPVRNISTLLVPPPTSSVENPTSNISHDQMHWQPLSKHSNERRTGRVPYLHREAWPPTHQLDQWHPQYQMKVQR